MFSMILFDIIHASVLHSVDGSQVAGAILVIALSAAP
jgi:hypothetical protein